MKTRFFMFGTILAVFVLFTHCFKDDPKINEESQLQAPTEATLDDYPRLENSYSVSNMKKALESLQNKSGKGPDNPYAAIRIKPTHFYVKFIPRNEEELLAVKRDTLIELYDHPLDVEDWVIRDFFNSIEYDNRPPELWAAVRVDHQLPKGCPSRILERLFIPDELKINPRGKNTNTFPYADELVEESLRLTGNFDDTQTATAKAGKWTPSGNIKALYNRPLQGLKVRARHWFTTHVGYTKWNGNFTCNGSFKNGKKANYSAVFEQNGLFDVRDGTFGQATHKAVLKIEGKWVESINIGPSLRFSYIYMAAFDRYFLNFRGTSPPVGSGTDSALKISYYHKEGNLSHSAWTNFGVFPSIRIYLKSENEDYAFTPVQIYAVTSHELSHSAH